MSSPTSIDLLVVTPDGEVRDYTVPAGETKLIRRLHAPGPL